MTVQPPRDWAPSRSPDHALPILSAGAPPLPISSLGEVFGAVRRRSVPLALWLALCLALAGWYLALAPHTFTAAATVILEPRQASGPPPPPGQAVPNQALDVAQAESQIQVVRSERILSPVFHVLGLRDDPEFADHGPGLRERLASAVGFASAAPPSPDDEQVRVFQAFTDRVVVRRLGQSYVLEIAYQARTAVQAERVANAIAVQYIKSQIDVKAAAALQGTEYLRGRIVTIEAEQRAAAEGVRAGRIPEMLFSDADARIIGAAQRPLNKSAPKGTLIVAFALTFGLVTGLLAVAVRQALDRTLTTRRQVREMLGVDCLAVLPSVALPRDRRRAGGLPLARFALACPGSDYAAALRGVRAAILLGAPDDRCRVVGVASWGHGAGGSTVASNLAHLLSVPSAPVVLIDGDLGAPTLTAALAPDAPRGLNEALLDGDARVAGLAVALSPTLGFVPAVAAGAGADANVHLGTGTMRALLAALRTEATVVIDLPSLANGSDIRALARHLDGIVLVAQAGRTTVEEASEAVQLLQASAGRVLGVVLNRAGPGRRTR